jgi:AcrR family transcriptional regulator
LETSSPRRPAGRRPGKNVTRTQILAAAERRFVADGYAQTSLRAVAREAGVDPALVNHFFGSKAGLFIAAVRWPIAPEDAVAATLAGDRAEAGQRLAQMFLRHWGESTNRSPILALIDAATLDPVAAELLRGFLMDQMLLPILEALGSDRRVLRAGLLSAQLAGLGLSRYVLGMVDPEQVSDDEVVAAVAPTLQRYLVEPLESGA